MMAVAMQWLAYYCVLAMRTPPAAFGSALSYVKICSAARRS